MNDPLPVRRVEAVRHLPRDVDRLLDRKRPPGVEPLPGGAPRHVVGDDEQLTLDVLEGVHRDDVRVHERGRGPGFDPEPLAPLLVGRVVGVEDLQRHEPGEPGVFGEVHDAHSASSERSLDPVGAEHGAGRHGHPCLVEQERGHIVPGMGEKPTGPIVRAEQRVNLGPQLAVDSARLVKKRGAFAAMALPRLVEQRRDTRPAISGVSHRPAMIRSPKRIRCLPARGTARRAQASSRA